MEVNGLKNLLYLTLQLRGQRQDPRLLLKRWVSDADNCGLITLVRKSLETELKIGYLSS